MSAGRLPKKLVGIGIDDYLQLATAQTDEQGYIIDNTIHRVEKRLSDDKNLHQQVADFLKNEGGAELLAAADAIGVNTIGVTDSENKIIKKIARKPKWIEGEKDFNIKDAIGSFVRSDFDFSRNLMIHNDASGSALAEAYWGRKPEIANIREDANRLFYIKFDNGINGAIIDDDVPLNFWPRSRHTEIGHIRPPRHQLDREFHKSFSGCYAHIDCYEGLASSQRIWRQWIRSGDSPGSNLTDLHAGHIAWEIQAGYIAQLCYTGIVTFSPDVIVISGEISSTDFMLEKIGREIQILNNGYFLYDKMKDMNKFLRPSLFGYEVTVFGALKLAERAWRMSERNLDDPRAHTGA